MHYRNQNQPNMEKEYLVQPNQYGDRKADYATGESINNKWKPISSKEAMKKNPEGTCGNIGQCILVDVKSKKIEYADLFSSTANQRKIRLSESISAALALYRMVCMIDNPIIEGEGAKGYKVPWTIKLIHVETGAILGISEWKGAFNIWTKFTKLEDVPESVKNDIAELLNLLLSDKSPHPYDGCTAGIVA